MISIGDVPEMLADWRRGELTTDEVYRLCLELFADYRGEELMDQLPKELRERFDDSLRVEFDNATPAEEYFWFSSGAGNNPNKVRIIHGVREYLARRGLSGR